MTEANASETVDLFVIGGGVNGCGIARDAAGRGMSVALAEMSDLASATSSSSTKLFHGGLRYLEYYEFRLVREALKERETLLRAMPHISWPMRFVLPHHKGLRPAWLLRLGLFVYDSLGGRKILPGTKRLDLSKDPAGKALKPEYKLAFEYSDCWVQDSRLVALNARDAEARGAEIMTRTEAVRATRDGDFWRVTIKDLESGATRDILARGLVNAGGPWVKHVIDDTMHIKTNDNVRLVGGSHIVTRRLFDHDKCYFFQGADGRIIFAIPYEEDFTLIGTTDKDHAGHPREARCSDEEADYLCAFASEYFTKPVVRDDIVWSYSGVRPLYDDGASSATAATRDYVLSLNENGPAPLLNVFGGKITTYRRLSEHALEKLQKFYPDAKGPWTAGVPLPGGDFPVDGVAALTEGLRADYPFLSDYWTRRLVRHYGTDARSILGDAKDAADLGEDFGATLTAREVAWLMDKEYARIAEDVVWRRTRLGLRLDPGQFDRLDEWMRSRRKETRPEVNEPAAEAQA